MYETDHYLKYYGGLINEEDNSNRVSAFDDMLDVRLGIL